MDRDFCGQYYCGLACDDGWVDCDGDDSNGCETPSTGPHAHETVESPSSDGCGSGGSSVGKVGQCQIYCDPGWYDCDNDPQNGCETQRVYGCYGWSDGGDGGNPTTPHAIAVLADDPRGVVACAGHEYYFDGSELRAIDSVTLANLFVTTSPGVPAGGLACDGNFVYWATLSDSDGSTPNGALLRVALGGWLPEVLADGLDPGRGVDLRSPASLYFIARSGLSDAGAVLGVLPLGADAGALGWMPVSETQAYKSFTITTSEDWSLANGSIYRKPLDGGLGLWLDDAGASALLTAQNGEPFAVVHVVGDAGSNDGGDAGDASASTSADTFAHLIDDSGLPNLAVVDASALHPIVATTSNTTILAASDDAVYLVKLPSGATTLIATTPYHIVDVALDTTWAVWTTRGQGPTPAQVWRAAVP